MRPSPLAYEAIEGLWETAVGWDDYVRNQDAARAGLTAILALRNYVKRSALRSRRATRKSCEPGRKTPRASCGRWSERVGGVDLVDTAMRLHRDERSVMDNACSRPMRPSGRSRGCVHGRSGRCGRRSRLSPSADRGASRVAALPGGLGAGPARRVWAQTLFTCPNPRQSGCI